MDALERAGATALELPLTRQVEPADGGAALAAAAASVQDNRWVVLTSVNAVERFMGALRDARALGGVLVAAVGPATADALRRAGVEPDLVPAEHSARGLVEEFPDADGVDGVGRAGGAGGAGARRVLFPCADLAPGTIPDGLAAKGWDVRRVEAYRTVARAAPEPALLDRVAAADALTLHRHLGRAGVPGLADRGRRAGGPPGAHRVHRADDGRGGPGSGARRRARGVGFVGPGHRRRVDRGVGPRG